MSDTGWRDLYDERSDTWMRVSLDVLQHLGYAGTLQVALHLKAKNPPAAHPGGATRAMGYRYTANDLQLIATVFLLRGRGQRVPVIRISTWEEWAECHLGREERN
ncbi:MAG: hypothetical protein L0Z62_14260 [Gemmataceae bacterium]|nr:hypothetical protein [Gemmataceae bacterium]